MPLHKHLFLHLNKQRTISQGQGSRGFRQVKIVNKKVVLLLGTAQLCKQLIEPFLAKESLGKTHTVHRLGTIVAFQFFVHNYSALVQQGLDRGKDVLHPHSTLQFKHFLFGKMLQNIQYMLFCSGKRNLGIIVGIIHHNTLALQLHTTG